MAIKGDPFRREYGWLSDDQKMQMDAVKRGYESLWEVLELADQAFNGGRDISLAKTHLQDSCMWAVRAITKMPGQE